jgi:hypothetical protein
MAETQAISYDMIVEARKGNMIAMGCILECLSPDVEKIIRCVSPGISEENLKDCKQEVLIRLIRIIPKFRLKY